LWRCVNKSDCSATVTLDVNLKKILRQSEHKCLSHQAKNDVLIKMNKLKKQVREDFTPITALFEKTFDTMPGTSTSSL
jgi:hypothetical protein